MKKGSRLGDKWMSTVRTIQYNRRGLRKVKRLYAENWVEQKADIGNLLYIGRERVLNRLEIKIQKELGIFVCVPGGDVKLPTDRERSLIDVFLKEVLTCDRKYDILNDIDGND